MKLVKMLMVTVVLSAISNISWSQEASPSAVGSALPDNIRALLIQEMVEVRNATQNILDGLVQGRDEVVAENAQAIHDSFIMAKKMSAADKKTLVNTVPAAFLAKDKAFHKLSADLAAAARSGDRSKQKQLFTELTDACAECHSAHAVDRFPGFSIGQQ